MITWVLAEHKWWGSPQSTTSGLPRDLAISQGRCRCTFVSKMANFLQSFEVDLIIFNF